MNVLFSFLLSNLKFRMIQVHPIAVLFGPAEDDQFLTRGEHSLQIVLIEPSADHPTAQRRIAEILQRDLDDFPSADILRRYFLNDAAKTDGFFGTGRRVRGKPGTVFIPPRIVLQQMPPRRDPEAL